MNDGKMPGRPSARMLSGSCQAKPDVTLSISSRGVDDAPRQMSEEVEKNRGYANRAMTLFEVDYCGGISRNRVVNTRFRGKSSQKKEKRFRGKKDD